MLGSATQPPLPAAATTQPPSPAAAQPPSPAPLTLLARPAVQPVAGAGALHLLHLCRAQRGLERAVALQQAEAQAALGGVAPGGQGLRLHAAERLAEISAGAVGGGGELVAGGRGAGGVQLQRAALAQVEPEGPGAARAGRAQQRASGMRAAGQGQQRTSGKRAWVARCCRDAAATPRASRRARPPAMRPRAAQGSDGAGRGERGRATHGVMVCPPSGKAGGVAFWGAASASQQAASTSSSAAQQGPSGLSSTAPSPPSGQAASVALTWPQQPSTAQGHARLRDVGGSWPGSH